MSLPQVKDGIAPEDDRSAPSHHHHHHQPLKPMFRDFLGARNCTSDAAASDARTSNSSPAPSLSAGARGRPISSASDLASERHVGSHYEEVPHFVPRGDTEINHGLVGRKRSSSDSAFPGLARDRMAQLGTDPHVDSRLMKAIQNGENEKLRRSNDEYAFVGMQRLQQGSSDSLVLRSGNNSRNNTTVSKWDQPISMNMGSAVQLPPRIRNSPMASHAPNRFREVQAGASPITAPAAADEGSRTGIKGPSIFSSLKSGVGPEKSSQGLAPTANRAMTGSLVAEPESSNIPSQNGMRPESRQMTIFYGGQAHVFDDVHPNKAEVIMAFAGSNGGSWSTIYSPKPKLKPSNDDDVPLRENSSGAPNNLAFVRDSFGKLPATRDPDPIFVSRDRISNPAGGPVGGFVARETRNLMEVTDCAADRKVDS